MDSEIDRFPVKSLMERYNITRSVLYNRLKGLGIVPTKFGRQSYVTGEELALLDQLHSYIQAGGYITGFIQEYRVSNEEASLPYEEESERNGNKVTTTQTVNGKELKENSQGLGSPELLERVIETTVNSTVKAIRASSEDTLEDLETLQRIADNGWLIPTKRLAKIIDRAPSTLAFMEFGCLVKSKENSFGIGKLIKTSQLEATIRHLQKTETLTVTKLHRKLFSD